MYSLLLKLFCSESLNLSDVSPATMLEKKKSNTAIPIARSIRYVATTR